MNPADTGINTAISILVILIGLTGYGIYMGFGEPSKSLDDPFDDHDD